jgi:hypothetical protein
VDGRQFAQSVTRCGSQYPMGLIYSSPTRLTYFYAWPILYHPGFAHRCMGCPVLKPAGLFYEDATLDATRHA